MIKIQFKLRCILNLRCFQQYSSGWNVLGITTLHTKQMSQLRGKTALCHGLHIFYCTVFCSYLGKRKTFNDFLLPCSTCTIQTNLSFDCIVLECLIFKIAVWGQGDSSVSKVFSLQAYRFDFNPQNTHKNTC